ncbi:glycoside hydrolase family 6 protein [Frondihabitans australicus]|uniref:Glucanase n=1 Tax=Frondihabitans australicus TaxID=386892 RepID=A0A495IH91_9MICO|nr:glycoside hydrolase family 6 protein [Frondihabitans australicus]RKR74515.1 endoglucanase [Frondihabitans australicus]
MPRHRSTALARAAALIAVAVSVAAGLAAGGPTAGPAAQAATPVAVLTPAQIQAASTRTLYNTGLAVQPGNQASQVVSLLRTKYHATAEANEIDQIASQPVAVWLGDWYSRAQLVKVITASIASAAKTGRTPVFVTYAIPDRDCGGYSAGGLTASQYLAWNQTIATALRGHRSAVLVEPDSLAMISSCPSVADTRLPLIRSAVDQLTSDGVVTYLDAGNSNWVAPAAMAQRLEAAGVGEARGFFTNVSNFYPTSNEVSYANRVSALTGGSHYVIDTSRNGAGWKGTWCNPTGAALGANPAVASGSTKLDATLWVKTPGASDGTCNGGPAAGTWWERYALGLVKNRAR